MLNRIVRNIAAAILIMSLASCSSKSPMATKPVVSDTLVSFYADLLVLRYDTSAARLPADQYQAKVDSLYRFHHLDSTRVTAEFHKMSQNPADWEAFFGAVAQRVQAVKPRTAMRF